MIEHDLEGPVNLAAPNPLPNAEFMRGLRAAWGIGIGLPATRWMLEVGTFLMRTESELVLKSRRVIPGRLLESGFTFKFPSWPEAAAGPLPALAGGSPFWDNDRPGTRKPAAIGMTPKRQGRGRLAVRIEWQPGRCRERPAFPN